jgi:hypothetical protein
MSEKLAINIINGLIYTDIELYSLKDSKYYTMSVLLDTGASVTTISDFVLKGLGYRTDNRTKTVRTANGNIRVCEVIMSEIKLGSLSLSDISVDAHTFPYECYFDGILARHEHTKQI